MTAGSRPPGYCCGHCLCSPAFRATCDRWARRGDRAGEGQVEWPRPVRAGSADLRRAVVFLRDNAAEHRRRAWEHIVTAVRAPERKTREYHVGRARRELYQATEHTTRAADCALAIVDTDPHDGLHRPRR